MASQPFLQQSNLLAHRTMGHAELSSRLLETAETSGRLESADRVQWRQTAAWDEKGHGRFFLTHDPIITDL
jgi:hypothetical protein